jgi:hypothetical protein
MDANDTEDILSQALEYRSSLRRELTFDSSWEEGDAIGGVLANGSGGQGIDGQGEVHRGWSSAAKGVAYRGWGSLPRWEVRGGGGAGQGIDA